MKFTGHRQGFRPNLVLITIECLRADYFGAPTPNLSRLSSESIVFTDAQTAGGWTRIAMTALMSSAYASMHGGAEVALATPARKALAECLIGNGYWTAAFNANPACGVSGGFQRGFGFYRDLNRKVKLPPDAQDWKLNWPRLLEKGIPPRDKEPFVDGPGLSSLGVEWLNSRPEGEPFFLWMHYLDPHWPCQMDHRPTDPGQLAEAWEDVNIFRTRVIGSRGRFDPGRRIADRWRRRYHESVVATDAAIAHVIDALRTRRDWDKTIVAITGDHGEELYERGTWHHSWNQLHREGTHVPLIIRVPGEEALKVTKPVGLVDLAPTLLDYAGIAPPQNMIGRSLRAEMWGQSVESRPVFTEMMGHMNSAMYRLAIRDGDWKYIYDLEDPHHSKLFNLADDPDEQIDVRDSYSSVFGRFERLRLAHVGRGLVHQMARTVQPKSGGVEPATSAVAPGPETAAARSVSGDAILREQLEALGYL